MKQSHVRSQTSQHSHTTEWVNNPEIIIIRDIPEKLISVLACEILDMHLDMPPHFYFHFFFFFFFEGSEFHLMVPLY